MILGVDQTKITADVPLHDIGVDSLSFVELLVRIEKVFSVNLMESGLTREDFQTVQALGASIAKLQP